MLQIGTEEDQLAAEYAGNVYAVNSTCLFCIFDIFFFVLDTIDRLRTDDTQD